ncbi:MAG: SDR family NAD(P)-dependent oxidoreductase [Saprospiraceae bacterium]|nr:SDR family NAD(P)-dependent oxidoreductase [Saprospiraceae bacterium]
MRRPSVFFKKAIIITGAASGIGKALARLLNKHKARLYLLDLNEEGLLTLSESLKKTNPNVFIFCFDVSDHERFENFCQEFLKTETSPDYLFNNAGIGIGGEVKDLDIQTWKRIIEVNLFGTINGVQLFYPLMVKNRKGHIVNISSLAGLAPLPGEAPYVASKYAIQGLTEALEIEASFYNVKVTAVCPGVVRTPIYRTGAVIGFSKKKILELWPKGITAKDCAELILEGVEKGKRIVVITAFAKAIYFAKRFFSSLLRLSFLRYFRIVKQSKVRRGQSVQNPG